MDHVTRATRF